MKYSVMVTTTVYCEVEVEAEDHIDAAQKVALAIVNDEDFEPDHSLGLDEVEMEVVTADLKHQVNTDKISLQDYDRGIVTFNADTVNQWIGELASGYEITPAGRAVPDDDQAAAT